MKYRVLIYTISLSSLFVSANAATILNSPVISTAPTLACGDLSNAAASCSTDTTSATNITSGALPAGRMPALTGDVTTSAGAVATTIANNAVTNAKAAQSGANTMKGNWTGSTANGADNAMPSCSDTSGNHLNYVSGTGITCGTTASSTGTFTQSIKTTNYTVLSGDSGIVFDTTGASAEVDFTLPTAAVGLHYCFTNAVAQTLKIIAGASTKIAIGTTNSATAGNITAAAAFSSVCMYAISTTQWVSQSSLGTWTVN